MPKVFVTNATTSRRETFGRVMDDASKLFEQEYKRGGLELQEGLRPLPMGLLAILAGTTLVLFSLSALGVALVLILGLLMPLWLAVLLIALLTALLGIILLLLGVRQVRKTKPIPERTLASIKEDIKVIWESLQ